MSDKCVKEWTDRIIRLSKLDWRDGPAVVYSYFDEGLQLLYVGISRNFHKRDLQHRKSSIWRRRAMIAGVCEYEARELAKLVEAWTHETHKPPCCPKWEKPRMGREYLPEQPDPVWYYTGGRTPTKLDEEPFVDEDDILVVTIGGEMKCRDTPKAPPPTPLTHSQNVHPQ